MTRYIDATPTWSAIVPMMREIVEHAETQEAVDAIWQEIARMANAADNWNAHTKEIKNET